MPTQRLADRRRTLIVRLGIDLDGVVANFIRGWMTRYNAEFGTQLTEDMVDHWDSAGDLTHFADLSDFWHWAGASGRSPTVFRHLDTYPGALGTLRSLAERHDVVVLTTKPDWAAADTFAWLADKRIPTREVHLLRGKWRVACDIYLDDSPYEVPGLVSNQPGSVVCRFVRPWNEPVEGALDVHSWEEFAEVVDRVAGGWDRTRRG